MTFTFDHDVSARLSGEYRETAETAAQWVTKDSGLLSAFAKAFGTAGYARLVQVTNYVNDRNYQASETAKGFVNTGDALTNGSNKVRAVDVASSEGFNRIATELL